MNENIDPIVRPDDVDGHTAKIGRVVETDDVQGHAGKIGHVAQQDDVEAHVDEQAPAAPAPAASEKDGDDKGTDDTDGHRFVASDREIKHDIMPLARR